MNLQQLLENVKIEGSQLPEADIKKIYAMAFQDVAQLFASSLGSLDAVESALRASAKTATQFADMIAAMKEPDDEKKEEKPDDEKAEGEPEEKKTDAQASETPEPK